MSNYVDLKRNFVPIAEDAAPDLGVGRSWGLKYGGWLDWPEVLDHARVVLLAEAQSGKTAEFKHAVVALRDGGRVAVNQTVKSGCVNSFGAIVSGISPKAACLLPPSPPREQAAAR